MVYNKNSYAGSGTVMYICYPNTQKADSRIIVSHGHSHCLASMGYMVGPLSKEKKRVLFSNLIILCTQNSTAMKSEEAIASIEHQ